MCTEQELQTTNGVSFAIFIASLLIFGTIVLNCILILSYQYHRELGKLNLELNLNEELKIELIVQGCRRWRRWRMGNVVYLALGVQ